jgi:hypothetical protein
MLSEDTDWREPVAAALRGRDIAFASEVAWTARGRRYQDMSISRWSKLAAAIKAAGFKRMSGGGAPYWIRQAPAQQPQMGSRYNATREGH